MEDILASIALCQKKLEKYATNYDEAKLIYYLSKLKHLPIKVSHLEQTGVGRSVNALRHIDGSVGDRARNLVGVWKKMVTAEEGSVGREQHDRGDRRSSSAAVTSARASPRPSKQQPPTPESPEDAEDDEDCERLQIEETVDEGVEDVATLPSPERLDPNCYDPSHPATEFSRLSTNGNKYLPGGSVYGRPGTASDTDHDSPRYDPYTSTLDYPSAGASNEPPEYQPTPVVSPDGLEVEERNGSTAPSEEEGAVEDTLESPERSLDYKSKSKHKERKKHKSRDKEKSSKDKHRHKSSDKSKDKSHKDKRKDKDRSPSKKSKHENNRVEVTNKDSLDRRRSKSHKSNDIDISPNSPNGDLLVNGHDVLPDIVTANDNSVASSSKNKSPSKHSSSKSSSSHSKESKKEDKDKRDKKDKKRTRDNDADHQSKNDHKSKKRKSNEQEGFGAALMGLDEESSSKQKKSKSHSKDDKSHKSKGSSSSKSSSSKSRSSSSHSSKAASDKQGSSSSSSQVNLAANSSSPPPPPQAHASSSVEMDVISPNYKPLPRVPLPEPLSLDDLEPYPSYLPPFEPEPQRTQQETLDQMYSSKGKSKRQIYSGRARAPCLTAVPSLFDLAVKCLQDNIDALEYTGGIPYDLLKPVFERATAAQLFNLENFNPYLLEDTHPLWEQHCKKDFKGKKPEEMETYRDMYMRLTDERKQKLKSLTENLQTKFVTKPPPRRQTQLAFVGTVAKPPKSVARAQAKYGTGVPVGTPSRTTKAAEILARKQAMQNMQRVERTTGGASNGPSARPSAASKKPRAPLMAKTMQFYKKTFRR